MTLPDVRLIRQQDTHRLIPSKYSQDGDSVLTQIAENGEHLGDIFDLDNATNDRPLAENNLALFAEARSQQPCDLPETLKGQARLGEVEGEPASPNGDEARGQKSSDAFVRVDIQDELERLRVLLGDGSDQAGDEQCSHIVGTSPGHWATRVMNSLEVEPVADAGLEVDEHILGHRVAVSESQAMELGESDDRPFDGRFADRRIELRVLQQGRQRFSGEAGQDERPVG
ncbi:MAG: hypothetical protein ACREM1_09595, partial [Longimicrobiales bacterium]